jgi:hypothetical protein
MTARMLQRTITTESPLRTIPDNMVQCSIIESVGLG